MLVISNVSYFNQRESSPRRRKQWGCFAPFMHVPYVLLVVLSLPFPFLVLLPSAAAATSTSSSSSSSIIAATTTSTAIPSQGSEEQRLIEEFLRHRYDTQLPNVGDGQSALVDKRGRVYWQSGGPTIYPQDVFGKSSSLSQWTHCKAIILSTLLWTCLLTLAITQRLWQLLVLWTQTIAPPPPIPLVTATDSMPTKPTVARILNFLCQFVRKIISIAVSILLTVTKPRFQQFTCNPYVIAIIYVLYLSESYTSSTRRYLANTLSQHHVETLMEHLRNTKPTVTWSLRCFHYDELPQTHMLVPLSPTSAANYTSTRTSTPLNVITNLVHKRKPYITTRRKKVFTHQATKQFEFSR
jgi:hypothetical protein